MNELRRKDTDSVKMLSVWLCKILNDMIRIILLRDGVKEDEFRASKWTSDESGLENDFKVLFSSVER